MKKIQFYLVVTSNGGIRTVKGKPDLKWDEIAVLINLELPKSLFMKPQIQASISIPEEAGQPNEITCEVMDNLKEAIEASMGIEVKLSIIPTEP